MKLWVVGEVIKKTRKGNVWECVGVFDDITLAEDACIDHMYFVGPLLLNDAINDKVEWDGCYYPYRFGRPDDSIPMPPVRPPRANRDEEIDMLIDANETLAAMESATAASNDEYRQEVEKLKKELDLYHGFDGLLMAHGVTHDANNQ